MIGSQFMGGEILAHFDDDDCVFFIRNTSLRLSEQVSIDIHQCFD